MPTTTFEDLESVVRAADPYYRVVFVGSPDGDPETEAIVEATDLHRLYRWPSRKAFRGRLPATKGEQTAPEPGWLF